VIFSIIGAFYYLRVVKMMFFDDPQEGAEEPVQPSGALAAALSINGLAVLLLGIFPGLLLSLTHYAIIG